MSPRTVQNPAWLLPKPEHPSLIRTNPHLLAWIWKKTEQSSRLRMTWGLCWTPSCQNSYSQCICSFKPWLTHSFPDIWHPSGYGLEVPCGFWIFWLFPWFCVCSNSESPSIWHSTYQTPTHRWNLQFHHLTGTRLANPFSYQGIPEFDFLCHSVGPELYDCTRIPLAHPLQSLVQHTLILQMMKLLLWGTMNLKQAHSLRLSTISSNPTPHHPSPKSGNLTHLMVPTHGTSKFSSFRANWTSGPKGPFWGWGNQGQSCPLLS